MAPPDFGCASMCLVLRQGRQRKHETYREYSNQLFHLFTFFELTFTLAGITQTSP